MGGAEREQLLAYYVLIVTKSEANIPTSEAILAWSDVRRMLLPAKPF